MDKLEKIHKSRNGCHAQAKRSKLGGEKQLKKSKAKAGMKEIEYNEEEATR